MRTSRNILYLVSRIAFFGVWLGYAMGVYSGSQINGRVRLGGALANVGFDVDLTSPPMCTSDFCSLGSSYLWCLSFATSAQVTNSRKMHSTVPVLSVAAYDPCPHIGDMSNAQLTAGHQGSTVSRDGEFTNPPLDLPGNRLPAPPSI